MYTMGRQGSRRQVNIWPGFVDGLASLLLVVIFVLMVFMIAQFFLSVALTGRDNALRQLESEIAELADLLALERDANIDLRSNIEEISSQLQGSLAEQESLTNQLRAVLQERNSLAGQLANAQAEAAKNAEELARLRGDAQQDQEALEEERSKLNEAIAAMEINEQRLQQALAAIASQKTELEDAYKTIDADKERIQAQLAELAILKSLRDEMMAKLADTADDLKAQKALTSESQAQVELLNRQIFALRQQLARLSVVLEATEAENAERQVTIKNLGKRLNVALASKVQELARYRSDFFGRLREVLGNRKDISIVGDRFVFQSEVLFASGSADLGEAGKIQLARLASALREISANIPRDIKWILRVDGHTDRNPIATYTFPSNWELSTARAISVVKFLISQGIAPDNLAATGFGEFQPLDKGYSALADRRNRRIELKLTQR